MRLFIAATLILLGGCNASSDGNNGSVTVQYDQNRAENTVSDIGNTAEGIGSAIANDVGRTADKIDNSAIVADDGQRGNSTDNRQ